MHLYSATSLKKHQRQFLNPLKCKKQKWLKDAIIRDCISKVWNCTSIPTTHTITINN
jgi:hypothetical protein